MKVSRILFIGLLLAALFFTSVLPVQAAPAPFNKVAPVQGATNLGSSTVTFSWTASSPGVTYYLCLITNSNQKCPKPKWRNAGNGTSFTVNNLALNTTYYWQVRADDGAGATEDANSGSWWSFNTNQAAPSAFQKTAPADSAVGVVLDPTLTWTASPNAVSYEYCIDTISNTACEDAWRPAGSTTSVHLTGLQFEQTYFWQVRARNISGAVEADAGVWFTFQTELLPAADFVKLSPTDGATGQPREMHLYWSTSLGAERYDYCVVPTTAVTPCTWVPVGLNTNATVTLADYDTDYSWQVRAVRTINDAESYTLANLDSGWTFTTMLEPIPSNFSKVVPTDTSTNQLLIPWLVWTTSINATSYEYCIVPGTVGACPLNGWQAVTGLSTSVHLIGASALQNGATYSWQVRALGAAGDPLEANAGTWWTFSTLPQPPTVETEQTFTVNEDEQLNGTLVATGPVGGDKFFALYGAEPDGDFTLQSNGQFSYTPPLNYHGTVTFQFRVSDGVNGPSGPYLATITVTPVNDAPVIAPIADTMVRSGATWNMLVSASDPDDVATVLHYFIDGAPPVDYYMTIDELSGSFSCAPVWSPALQKSYDVTLRVSDGLLSDPDTLSTTETFTITVQPNMILLPVVRR